VIIVVGSAIPQRLDQESYASDGQAEDYEIEQHGLSYARNPRFAFRPSNVNRLIRF
jgi:hypothetical protein